MKYSTIKASSHYKNDNACCTVVASSVAFNQDFKQTQDYYSSQGRRRGQGLNHISSIMIMRRYADKVGGNVEMLNPKTITGCKTLTVGNSIKYLDRTKNYIMFSRGHAIGVKNGIVEDWSKGSKRPIKEIYCITPPNHKEVLQPVKVETVGSALAELTNLMNQF